MHVLWLANVPGHSELRKGLDPKAVDQRHPIPLPLLSGVGLAGVEIALVDVPDDVKAALLMINGNFVRSIDNHQFTVFNLPF